MKTQISLEAGLVPLVIAVCSVNAGMTKLILHVVGAYLDQSGWKPRLVRIYIRGTGHFDDFVK